MIYAFPASKEREDGTTGWIGLPIPTGIEEPSKPLLSFTRVGLSVALPGGSPLTTIHESTDPQNARGTVHTGRFGTSPRFSQIKEM